MQISNNVKGIISLIQSMMLVFGTSQFVQNPTSYEGLIIAVIGAIIGAVKHWADSQGTTSTTTTTPGPTQ